MLELVRFMRTAAVSTMILVLVAIVALCPVILCPLIVQAQAGSCCHKPPRHGVPCPAQSVPACPYSLLEKSNATPAASYSHVAVARVTVEQNFVLPLSGLAVHPISRLVDTDGLFLRNRVLLI